MKASITARFAHVSLAEEHGEVRERRDQLTHPPYQKPSSCHRLNQLWSWDMNQATRPREMDVLLLVRDPRCVQPLRHRWMVVIAKAPSWPSG